MEGPKPSLPLRWSVLGNHSFETEGGTTKIDHYSFPYARKIKRLNLRVNNVESRFQCFKTFFLYAWL